MSRRNRRYCYHQDHYYQEERPDWIDWITGLVMFGGVVVAIISYFIFDTEGKAKLANDEATRNYEKIISIAVRNCDLEVVEFLIERNLVNIYENRNCRERSLEYAAEKGCLEVTQFLVEKKVDINATRALLYAAEQGNLEVIKFLLQKGANPNVRSYGQTPRDLAAIMLRRNENNKPYREIIDLLYNAEKQYTPGQ
ncbi:UNVERIFIED_CONTAM: ankyrin repeat protein L99 [Trichonephila clavipes]